MDEQRPQEVIPALEVRYVGIGELKIYCVSEDELRTIESGTPAATMLNLAIALLALGFGSLVSLLLSAPSPSFYKFIVIVLLIIVSFVGGLLLLILWRQYRIDAFDIIQRIRLRGAAPTGPPIIPTRMAEDETDQ